MLKCPCEECLKLAICRYKDYNTIVRECSDIHDYIVPDLERNYILGRIKEIEKTIRPIHWYLCPQGLYVTRKEY